jgi:hypothetical protein
MPTSSTTTTRRVYPTSTSIPDQLLSALENVNDTVSEWRIDHLPSNVTIVGYNITSGAYPNITIISRMNPTSVGSAPLIPFIYLMMSIIIILVMMTTSVEWVRSLTSRRHRWEPEIGHSALTERNFEQKFLRFYSSQERSQQSQAEIVMRKQGTESEDIQACQRLIRAKFRLETQIWSLRDAIFVHRPAVEDMKRRAKGAMGEIMKTTEGWTRAKDQWDEAEWMLVEEIHRRVNALKMD